MKWPQHKHDPWTRLALIGLCLVIAVAAAVAQSKLTLPWWQP